MGLRTITVFLVSLYLFHVLVAKPIHKEKGEEEEEKDPKKREEAEYLRYLGQVVEILEEDEDFKKKLHNATEQEIRSGEIADHVDLLSHKVRTKLDELKRMEVEYQRRLHKQSRDKANGINNRSFWNPMFDENQDTFETDDLKKLLNKHNAMMEDQDKKRKEDFHKYEMEKEHNRRAELNKLPAEEKKKKEVAHEEELKQVKKHEKMHQPGSKAELEEVWKEEDGLDPESFDPKTFFKLHDKNGDGYLDTYELETFFLGDVDKVYNESDSTTDPKERQEELERMREHVMKQMDKDHDGLVSADEFIKSTNDPEFEKDEEWKPVSDGEEYTEDEMKEYEKQLEEEAAKNQENETPQSHEQEEHHEEPGSQEHHEEKQQQHEEKQQQHDQQQQQHEQKEDHHDKPEHQ